MGDQATGGVPGAAGGQLQGKVSEFPQAVRYRHSDHAPLRTARDRGECLEAKARTHLGITICRTRIGDAAVTLSRGFRLTWLRGPRFRSDIRVGGASSAATRSRLPTVSGRAVRRVADSHRGSGFSRAKLGRSRVRSGRGLPNTGVAPRRSGVRCRSKSSTEAPVPPRRARLDRFYRRRQPPDRLRQSIELVATVRGLLVILRRPHLAPGAGSSHQGPSYRRRPRAECGALRVGPPCPVGFRLLDLHRLARPGGKRRTRSRFLATGTLEGDARRDRVMLTAEGELGRSGSLSVDGTRTG